MDGVALPVRASLTGPAMYRRPLLRPGWLLALLLVAGAVVANLPAIRPVPHVDLARFMGTWYLVGGIPTRYEREAWNAVETYTGYGRDT